MTLSMFTESDREKANHALNSYNYNHKNAIEHTAQGEFLKAAIYHRNAAGFLEELQSYKNTKETYEEINLKISQIKGDQDRMEMLRRNYF